MTTLQLIHDVPVLMCDSEGEAVCAERDVVDLIGDAGYQGARWVAVPAERFDDGFFQLRTRVVGDIVQKFVNYRLGLAVMRPCCAPPTRERSAQQAEVGQAPGVGMKGARERTPPGVGYAPSTRPPT